MDLVDLDILLKVNLLTPPVLIFLFYMLIFPYKKLKRE